MTPIARRPTVHRRPVAGRPHHVHESGGSDHQRKLRRRRHAAAARQFLSDGQFEDIGVRGLSDLTLGLTVLSLFGIKYKYPDGAPFVTAGTRTSLELTDIKPTIGIGADIYTFLPFWDRIAG